jgi:two-component system sensor histidine kinase BaeS
VTGDPSHALGSPLGRRLLAAFLLVALSSVVVLTAAALVGTDRGLASAHNAERQRAAARTADAAAAAYVRAGGWNGADLSSASAVAEAAGARLVVRDANGAMVWPGRGMGPGAGGMHTDPAAATVVEAAVTVDGRRTGTVRLAFPVAASGGRAVAWSWVLGAAGVALAAALIVSGYVSRRLTRPLVALAAAAHRFAAGQRDARATVAGPGELGEVTRAFNGMAEEVVRAERVRRSLSADVAHELRTPLAALQAGLEELRDGLGPPDTARLAGLHDQTLRLSRIVQDLADLSAAESAALSLHPADIDLAEVVRAALDAQRSILDAAGLEISTEIDGPLPVHGDPDRLHQAVANLLANAARYCRPGDRVAIRGHVDGASVVLEVSDTGPGIPADEIPHVFDRLWRGRLARTVAGSGIGLAVVRELVTAHGGSVTATSGDGDRDGTTVAVRLPVPATVRVPVRR